MRGSELLDKLELVDPVYITFADTIPPQKRRWKRWIPLAACLALLFVIVLSPLSALFGGRGGPGRSDPMRPQNTLELNGAYYRVVGLEDTETLDAYNLPHEITADMVGEDLGHGLDDKGEQTAETFYQYAPYADIKTGEQRRAQRAVYLVSKDGEYAFALFCCFVHFDTNTYQEAGELFAVYGVDSAEDLCVVRIGEEEISDPARLKALFDAICTAEGLGRDDYETAVSGAVSQSDRQQYAVPSEEGGTEVSFLTKDGLVIRQLRYFSATGFLSWGRNYYKLSALL